MPHLVDLPGEVALARDAVPRQAAASADEEGKRRVERLRLREGRLTASAAVDVQGEDGPRGTRGDHVGDRDMMLQARAQKGAKRPRRHSLAFRGVRRRRHTWQRYHRGPIGRRSAGGPRRGELEVAVSDDPSRGVERQREQVRGGVRREVQQALRRVSLEERSGLHPSLHRPVRGQAEAGKDNHEVVYTVEEERGPGLRGWSSQRLYASRCQD
mmetsp:Transcript_14926/g.52384  ORF Transcript_14926/g.52384 Transcript_14926/m.52384 type:complete len:213 (-) Transcript_14926:139-777(-)